MRNFVRSAVIGAIIATVPVSASVAAVRPNAAVPTASAATVATQAPVYEGSRPNLAAAWPLGIFAIVMGGLVLLEVLDDDDDNERPLTRA